MNATAGRSSRHLEDGALMGYMDHALDLAGHRRAEGHLAYCAECRTRLERLRAAASGVGGWLETLDAPVAAERRDAARAAIDRARFRRRRLGAQGKGALAAAAVAVVALTLSFGTAPGRAWIGDAAQRLGIGPRPHPIAAEAGGDEAAAASAERAGEPVPAAGEGGAALPTREAGRARGDQPPPGTSHPVHFDPAGNYVLVRFASRQRVGTAAIWVRDEPRASAQVVSGRRNETISPAADGVLIRNQAASGADYVIVVPPRYRMLRVRVGDEPETRIPLSRSGAAWLWTLNLAEARE